MVLLFWRTVKYMLDWRVDMQYYFDMANERTIEEKRAFLERLLSLQAELALKSHLAAREGIVPTGHTTYTEQRLRDPTSETVAEYELAGEPDGCYFCGSHHHHSSDCREDA